MQPRPLNVETLERLRELAGAMYGGRDELYAAAKEVGDEDLAVICRTLADDLAGDTAYLEQIIVKHGHEPGFEKAVTSTLSDAIMKILRQGRGDEGVVSQAKQAQTELRERMDETIAQSDDPEVHAVLDQQKQHLDFAERVLRQAARSMRKQASAMMPDSRSGS